MTTKMSKCVSLWKILLVFFLLFILVPNFASSEETYIFDRMWPTLQQPWYFNARSGIAVDTDGYIYVGDYDNHRIQKFTSGGQFMSTWGSFGSGDGEFNHPRGIAVDNSGFVYVADMDNDRIQKFTSDGQFMSMWGSSGSGDGEFYYPMGIAIDNSGFVYVADYGNHRIQKFTSGGQFMSTWGSFGSGDGEFNHPRGIAVDNSNFVYVADYGNHRIQKFTSDGQFVDTWGSSGSGDGEFNRPSGIAIDRNNLVYIVDGYNHRIQKFTSDGQFMDTWGSFGSGDGEFNRPSGIAIDRNKFVYVADYNNHRIQKFTSDGRFVDKWGSFGSGDGEFRYPSGVAVDASDFVYVVDFGNRRIQKFTSGGQFRSTWGSSGSGDGEFRYPRGIAVDTNNFVYVVDGYNDRIQKFTPEGLFVDTWGSSGSGDGEFLWPEGIAVDTNNFVYVVDGYNHRIQKFTSEGQFLATWGALGSSPGQFAQPTGLCIDEGGRVYVSDWTFNRIQVFKNPTIHTNNKAIIVAGSGPYPGNNIWKATQMCANFAYRALTYQGYDKDTIYYLSDTNLDLDDNHILDDVNADATNSNLNYSISTWAKDADNVFIYMVGHGGEGTFRMAELENLTAEDLDTWLDTLQDTIPGSVTLVYDACRSGSFLPILDAPSGKERIIATSASKNEEAIFGDQGRISFGWFFWGNMFNGDSFYDSFFHAMNSIGVTYHQNSLLDANGNGIGNEKEDQDIVRSLTIGNETKSAGDIPTIGSVSPGQTLDGEISALIYADNVIDADGISRVRAVITPPGYSSSSPDNPVTDLPTFDLNPVGDNRYEGVYIFTSGGTYNIAIFAYDREGMLSLPKATTVTVLNGYPDGDVAPLGSRDGKVNVGDALVALRFALGLETPTSEDTAHGDVAPFLDTENKPNPDGVINVGDALVILRKALGIIGF